MNRMPPAVEMDVVVGWMVAVKESAHLAERLIEQTCAKQRIQPQQLTIHADRGAPMRSKLVALLFSDLGIAASHSRPRVSNDNPFSEAQFRTFKYRPEFPKRFGALEHARAICHDLLPWYNDAHHHSGPAISRRPTWITDARRRSSTCVTAPASWSTPRIQSNSSADHHTQKPCRPMDQSTVENDPPGCPKTDDRHPGRLAACGRCPAATAARSVVVSPRRWRGVATVNAEPDCLKDVDTARRAYADYEMPNALEDAPGRPSERLPAKHDRNHVP